MGFAIYYHDHGRNPNILTAMKEDINEERDKDTIGLLIPYDVIYGILCMLR